jgi:tetratricopeptide (TPR) repeat protein
VISAGLILVAVLVAYFPALRGGLLWDDDAHVTKASLQSLPGLGRIWFEVGATQQYYPLLHSAFWVEHRLWGDSVLGYHLSNVFFHAGAAWLLFVLLRRLSFPAPLLAAFLFALHPVCVESVAWISEQKNTLSAVFYLSSALVYLQFDATRNRKLYSWALALFVLALLTKTVTSTLPAALLVVFWWKRGRLVWKEDILPLVPWIIVAAASGLFTAWTEAKFIGAQGADFSFTAMQRLLLAGKVIVFYAGQLAWPAHLMFIYPRWTLDPTEPIQWLFLAGVLIAAVCSGLYSRRSRGPLAGLLLFVGTLFPALGFVNVYPFRFSFVADHFQYLASIGIIVPGAWLIWKCARALRLHPAAQLGVCGVVSLALCCATWSQARIYRDSETLYRLTLAVNPAAWLMHYNLAVTLSAEPGHLSEAIAEYRATLQLKPDHWEAHNNLASALLKSPGHVSEALAHYAEALHYNPDFADAENNLGVALEDEPGRLGDAENHLRAAIRIQPAYDAAHSNLGALLLHKPGAVAEARAEFEKALQIAPANPDYHYNLANALSLVPGRLADAVSEYGTALKLRPEFPEAESNLGVALAQDPDRMSEAIDACDVAVKQDPSSAVFHENLAGILARAPGRSSDAIQEYRAALAIDPTDAQAHYGLGLLLTASPGGQQEATSEFAAATRLNPDFAEAHFCLGISFAMSGGRRLDAERELERALELRPDFERARTALNRLHASPP